MELYERIEHILANLRPVFRRKATYEWFVLLMWGALLCSQGAAVTSYLNSLGLSETYYQQALHWFHSTAFSVDELCQRWGAWLAEHPDGHHLNAQRVYVGDGIKVGKEGRKMPGVKWMHQESADVNKPEYLRGHYFSALGLLLSRGRAMFCTPVVLKLHDGLDEFVVDHESGTLVEKMALVCVQLMEKGSYALLDAYYASTKVLGPFREAGLNLISRARSSTVARAPFCSMRGKRGPGRPRQWGSAIKLWDLFAPTDDCNQAKVYLYGQLTEVYFQCFQFYWDDPQHLVLFVLTQLPNGKRLILLSSDTTLSGEQVIEAYCWRFKVELCFRTLVMLLGGFAYRFWLRSMAQSTTSTRPSVLAQSPQAFQQLVLRKVEAFERFVNLNAIALGLLQILSLEMSPLIWQHFPRWFRTLPDHGFPSEQIVRLSLQHLQLSVLPKSRPRLLLNQLLQRKIASS